MKVTCKPSDPHEPLLCSDLRKFQSFSPGRHAFVHYVSLFRVIYSQVNMISTMCMMLETKCIGDNFKMSVTVFGHFGYFAYQHPMFFYINVGHQYSKDVTKIEFLSPISKNCHLLQVTNITVTS